MQVEWIAMASGSPVEGGVLGGICGRVGSKKGTEGGAIEPVRSRMYLMPCQLSAGKIYREISSSEQTCLCWC